MHALLDLDILCYEMGSATDNDGLPLAWPLVQARVRNRIADILEACNAETWEGYLSGPRNFRNGYGTILQYKGNRPGTEKPYWYQGVYNYIRDSLGAEVTEGYEADDAITIASSERETIICSRDKDLLQVPGPHYVWNFTNSKDSTTEDLSKIFFPHLKKAERSVFNIEPLQGLRFFYAQCLTGDSTDNILGLFNVGPKSAAVRRVHQAGSELDCFRIVKEEYEKRFGSYWDMFLCENGRLLWMLRTKDDDWYERQKELTEQL